MPDPPPIRYSICDTRKKVEEALSVLTHFPLVIFDCEGKTLGRVGGALSLLCLGTPVSGPDQRIYLFDIPALRRLQSHDAVEAIVHLLTRTDIIKVVWDGKMDAVEIFRAFGVKLARVLDLQIVELFSRWTVLGEGEKERLVRLGAQFQSAVQEKPELFEGIHAIIGMQKCLETYLPHLNVKKDSKIIMKYSPIVS